MSARVYNDSIRRSNRGFTLLELLIAMAILALMVAMLFSAFGQASRGWLQAENRVETFTQARAALDFMTRELTQAIATTNISFLGNANSIAFIAPVSTDPTKDGVDIEEVVYRLSSNNAFNPGTPDPSGFFVDANPPYKLVRRASAYFFNSCTNYYGTAAVCPDPWDFYTSVNWPETSEPSRVAVLAENIISLQFTFYSTNGLQYAYWNSSENCPNLPCAPGMQNTYRPWQHEILGPPDGIGYNDLDIYGALGSNGAQYMTNRAPAGVQITIGVIDSRAVAKIKAGAPLSTITNQAMKVFSTFVAIPNRQP